MSTITEAYDEALEDMVYEFVTKWYAEIYDEDIENEDDEDVELDYDIIGGHLAPGPVCINEELYFDIDDIYVALKHDIPMAVVEKWNNYALECYQESDCSERVSIINLYNYWRMTTDGLKFQEEKAEDLKKSEENVKDIEAELMKMLEKYGAKDVNIEISFNK